MDRNISDAQKFLIAATASSFVVGVLLLVAMLLLNARAVTMIEDKSAEFDNRTSALEARLTAANSQPTELAGVYDRLSRTQGDVDMAKSDITAMKNSINTMKSDITTLQTDLASAKMRLLNAEIGVKRANNSAAFDALGNLTLRLDRLSTSLMGLELELANLTATPETQNATKEDKIAEIPDSLRYQSQFDCYWSLRERGYGKYLLVNELCATRTSAYWMEACECAETICEFNPLWC